MLLLLLLLLTLLAFFLLFPCFFPAAIIFCLVPLLLFLFFSWPLLLAVLLLCYFPFVVRLIQFSYTHVPGMCVPTGRILYHTILFRFYYTSLRRGRHRFSLCGYLYLCYEEGLRPKSV